MDELAQDVRYALRTFRRHPGFVAIVLTTLGLGIGAATAIFSVVYGVLWRPLPYAEPNRLVLFLGQREGSTPSVTAVSIDDFRDWKTAAQSFESMSALAYWTFNLTGRDVPARLVGVRVSGDLFPMMGVAPLVGRTLLPADDAPGRSDVVVLGHRLWQRMFGGEAAVVGQPILLNGVRTEVVGVMPDRFRFPADDVELWAPLGAELTGTPRNGRFLFAAARLTAAATSAGAQAEMQTLAARLEQTYPDTNRGWGVQVVSLREAVVEQARPALLLLFGAVVLVLAIACANVAHLLLARAARRQPECALRAALGAGRGRLVRQLLTESALLWGGGAVVGGAIASWAVPLLRRLAPAGLPRLDEIHVDLPVLGATVAATLVSAVAFGLAPALHAASAGVPHASNRVAGHRRQRRLRSSLVVLEVAAALVLLVGGGLLLRSLARVLSVDPGFSNESVVSMNVFLTGQKYRQLDQQKAYVARAIADLGTVPGVAAAGAISHLPLGGGASTQPFVIEARDVAAGDAPSADYRVISPGYFATMGIAIREGRAFTDGDRETSERVVIVNETMARRFWGGASPIGSRLRWATPSRAREGVMTVVGVAGDVRSVGLDADERPAIYAPFTQRTLPFLRWTSFVVRTAGDPVAAIPVIRRALLTIDPEQPVYEETTIAQLLAASVAERRFSLLLLGIFAIVALALATIGLYGLISFSVAERTREIGVRVALGASARRVYLLVLTEALTRTAAGLLIGLAGAVALSRWLGALLYQVAPTDPLTYAAVTALLLASAIVAGYVPARRAVRADPVEALRAD